jgi:putative FmdB family regulatory protein
MPIFEYRCRGCNALFESIVLSPREKITCPQCQGSAVDKQLSVFSAPAAAKAASAPAGGCACTPQTCGCH